MFFDWLEITDMKYTNQGARNIANVRSTVETLIRTRKEKLVYHDGYNVHMAVLTASLGKKVSVANGKMFARVLCQAIQDHGGQVSMEYINCGEVCAAR